MSYRVITCVQPRHVVCRYVRNATCRHVGFSFNVHGQDKPRRVMYITRHVAANPAQGVLVRGFWPFQNGTHYVHRTACPPSPAQGVLVLKGFGPVHLVTHYVHNTVCPASPILGVLVKCFLARPYLDLLHSQRVTALKTGIVVFTSKGFLGTYQES